MIAKQNIFTYYKQTEMNYLNKVNSRYESAIVSGFNFVP